MKISKISLILLSGLLVTQATMPMETPAKSALKKAQKAGKIALRIGAGTATFGVYALLGTAALASWGITLGAAAVSLARLLTPKANKPQAITPEAPKAPAAGTQKATVKKPMVNLQRTKNAPKNRANLCTKTAVKAASMVGLAAVENDMLDTQALKETRMTREQVAQARHQKALEIKAELEKCNEQSIQWNTAYTRTYHAELPRYEGPYQDMIGIYDGDIEDMRNESRMQMKAQIDRNWEQSGCKESDNQLQALARRMAQNQMRLPK